LAGIKITDLPAAPSALLTDVFPVDQLPGPITYKESNSQLLALFQTQMPSSVTGTTDQALVNGTTGTPQVGAVTLTLPQNIDPNCNFQCNSVQINTGLGLLDDDANEILALNPIALAVNYLEIQNNSTGSSPYLLATGSDANVNLNLSGSGTGYPILIGANTSIGYAVLSGTANQHTANIIFTNAATTQSITYLDTNQTVVATAAALTNGQLAIGNTGNLPTAATLSAGAGISIVNAAGSITISSSTSGMTWTTVVASVNPTVIDHGYVANSAGLLTFTLPALANVGDIIAVEGLGAGGWTMAANAGQTIKIGSATTSVAGSLSSVAASDNVYVTCIVQNTTWRVRSTNSAGLTIA